MGRQEIVKTDVNFPVMINEAIEELSSQTSDNHNIEWSVASLPHVSADINTIRQVWINLISNAIKYSGNEEHPHIEIGSFSHESQTTPLSRIMALGSVKVQG